MRRAWRLMKRRLILSAFALAAATAQPAVAGSSAADPDWLPGLSRSADSGKPAIVPPAAALEQNESGSCQPPLPCGTRLWGTVRKNGGVELQVPVLHW